MKKKECCPLGKRAGQFKTIRSKSQTVSSRCQVHKGEEFSPSQNNGGRVRYFHLLFYLVFTFIFKSSFFDLFSKSYVQKFECVFIFARQK